MNDELEQAILTLLWLVYQECQVEGRLDVEFNSEFLGARADAFRLLGKYNLLKVEGTGRALTATLTKEGNRILDDERPKIKDG